MTQAVKASIIIFIIPVSIILAYFGFIDPITADPVLILIKIMGIVLMLLGILSFALTLTKAYVFVKMKSGQFRCKLLQIHKVGDNVVRLYPGIGIFTGGTHIPACIKACQVSPLNIGGR